MKTNDYLALPYHFQLMQDHASDGTSGWVASVVELPGCLAQGASAAEAIERAQEAMEAWIDDALAVGDPVPRPAPATRASGRLLLRMPASLHERLIAEATSENVSLNQFVVAALSGAVGWRRVEVRPMGRFGKISRVTRVGETVEPYNP